MATYEVNVEEVEPMSRTYQYRKVMKPMLERKRRARINKCLDELKDLMVGALQSEGESITKLEKADVLELTVRHLTKLKQHHALALPSQNHAHEKFKAGFGHCATEVRRFVQAVPGVDMHISARLLSHLGQWMSQLDKMSPPSITTSSPTSLTSPISVSPPAPMNLPRIYTPPASPESKPSSILPISAVTSQPLALTIKSQSASPVSSFQINNLNSPPVLQQNHSQTNPSASRICNTQPIPLVMKASSPVNYVIKPHSPVIHQEYSSVFAPQKEPINYSPNPTGIKVEIPLGSPVWRPW